MIFSFQIKRDGFFRIAEYWFVPRHESLILVEFLDSPSLFMRLDDSLSVLSESFNNENIIIEFEDNDERNALTQLEERTQFFYDEMKHILKNAKAVFIQQEGVNAQCSS